MDITFTPEILAAGPGLEVLVIEADIPNCPTPDWLWEQMELSAERLRASVSMPDINKRPGIAATRAAYRAAGKDPNRYRPSAEALCRRLVKGADLYRTTALVDLINILSIESGYSIGGFDADRISGPTLTLGIGREGEPFEAIGRGPLNIAGLPVYRDATGPIGTPTSDHVRTSLSPDTRRLLMIVNMYGTEMSPEEFTDRALKLLSSLPGACAPKVRHLRPHEC